MPSGLDLGEGSFLFLGWETILGNYSSRNKRKIDHHNDGTVPKNHSLSIISDLLTSSNQSINH